MNKYFVNKIDGLAVSRPGGINLQWMTIDSEGVVRWTDNFTVANIISRPMDRAYVNEFVVVNPDYELYTVGGDAYLASIPTKK